MFVSEKYEYFSFGLFCIFCLSGRSYLLPYFYIYKPNSITAALKILLLAVFYFFVRTFIRFRSQFSILYIGIAILSGLLSLISILFFLIHRDKFYSVGFDDLTNFRQYYRPFGQLSNDWATVLLCLLPFSLVCFWSKMDSKWRYGFICITILNLTTSLVGFSRGAYVALFVFFAFVFLGIIMYSKKSRIKVFTVLGVLFCGTILLMYPERKALLTTCCIVKTTSQKRSIEGRFVKWNEAISLFRLFPATGVGGGNYALASDMYPQERRGLFTSRSTNTYLQVLVEKGLLGLLSYGGLFCAIIFLGIKRVLKGDCATIIFFSALWALWVREFTFSSLFEMDMLLVLFVLMVLAIVQPVKHVRYGLFEVSK